MSWKKVILIQNSLNSHRSLASFRVKMCLRFLKFYLPTHLPPCAWHVYVCCMFVYMYVVHSSVRVCACGGQGSTLVRVLYPSPAFWVSHWIWSSLFCLRAGPGSFHTHPHSAPELQMLATEPGFLHMGTRTQVSMLVQPALYSLASSLAPNDP